MGTRSRCFIAISPSAQPDFDAAWIGHMGVEIFSDDRGTLLQFEENQRPLAYRFPQAPGDAYLFDLENEVAMYGWLGRIGKYRFRFVRGDERLEQAGEMPASAWFDVDEVRELEHQVLTGIGPEFTAARHSDFALRLTFEQFQRTGRAVEDLRTLPGAEDVAGFADPWGGRAYGGTRDLEARLHLFQSGPEWLVEVEHEQDMELEQAERALYEVYRGIVAEHHSLSGAAA